MMKMAVAALVLLSIILGKKSIQRVLVAECPGSLDCPNSMMETYTHTADA